MEYYTNSVPTSTHNCGQQNNFQLKSSDAYYTRIIDNQTGTLFQVISETESLEFNCSNKGTVKSRLYHFGDNNLSGFFLKEYLR